MPQLRDEWEGHDASLEGFPAMEVFAKLDVLLDLDVALLDEDLRHPHGAAARFARVPLDEEVPRPDLGDFLLLFGAFFGAGRLLAALAARVAVAGHDSFANHGRASPRSLRRRLGAFSMSC